jgi:hypothetical protein
MAPGFPNFGKTLGITADNSFVPTPQEPQWACRLSGRVRGIAGRARSAFRCPAGCRRVGFALIFSENNGPTPVDSSLSVTDPGETVFVGRDGHDLDWIRPRAGCAQVH